MGEGVVRDRAGVLGPTAEAFTAVELSPVSLAEKEGLALINGTDGMLGMLVLAIVDLRRLLRVADVTAAMSVEGLLGTDDVRRRRAAAVSRPAASAANCGRSWPAARS
jgi:histidine ammonia-lyase